MNPLTEDLRALRRRVSAIEADLADVWTSLQRLEHGEAEQEIVPVVGPETLVATRAPAPAAEPEVRATENVPPPLPVWVSAPPSPEPVGPAGPPVWQLWLQRLQLWPPQGEGNLEIRLGAWWATRIGALLAVIGVVFFGVYLSLDTSPAVKFTELLAIAAGVTWAGRRLEARLPRYGVVVLAAGLAMGYFAIYAGYALPAVKVFHSPWLAAAAQLAAAGALGAVAVRRRHETVATVALALGFVTVWFSRAGGLGGLALLTALVLAAGVAVAGAGVGGHGGRLRDLGAAAERRGGGGGDSGRGGARPLVAGIGWPGRDRFCARLAAGVSRGDGRRGRWA